ncbi:MAG: c-type cytochrome [Myxococcales bacterium]|nr:c-type cytochrome [Myxococcales bacterium]
MFGGIEKDLLDNFKPLPKSFESKTNPSTPDKVALGRMLYYETRLSRGHDISCNTCHMLDKFGVDRKVVSDGHGDQKGTRNSPTVYNAAGHFVQFWDGRAKDVEEQAKGPILNPVEMAMKAEADVVGVLKSIPGYVEAFKKAFPNDKDPITYNNLVAAIGAFERKLVTPSQWDLFLAGDVKALTAAQKAGFKQFVEAGCPTCHSGPLVGGHIYQKLGLVKPWPSDKDKGRYEATKKDEDKMMFKVPSLRNVVETAPYFHDGSVKKLEKAVTMMAWHQLGRKVTPEQAKSIVTFLGALTGDVPTEYIKKPELPKSGPKTPKPDKTVDKAKGDDKPKPDKKAPKKA